MNFSGYKLNWHRKLFLDPISTTIALPFSTSAYSKAVQADNEQRDYISSRVEEGGEKSWTVSLTPFLNMQSVSHEDQTADVTIL